MESRIIPINEALFELLDCDLTATIILAHNVVSEHHGIKCLAAYKSLKRDYFAEFFMPTLERLQAKGYVSYDDSGKVVQRFPYKIKSDLEALDYHVIVSSEARISELAITSKPKPQNIYVNLCLDEALISCYGNTGQARLIHSLMRHYQLDLPKEVSEEERIRLGKSAEIVEEYMHGDIKKHVFNTERVRKNLACVGYDVNRLKTDLANPSMFNPADSEILPYLYSDFYNERELSQNDKSLDNLEAVTTDKRKEQSK
jgi:hypothetical protein